MFSPEELNALAETAKNKLNNNGGQGVSADEDLYAEFREYENTPVTASEPVENKAPQEEVNYEDVYNGLQTEPSEVMPNPELDPYDELLFPGGPTKSQINAWKKEWDGYDIYITEILNKTFIFRTLNRFEYKQLVSLADTNALQREEVVCQTVTLWPADYNWQQMSTTLAGIPSTYAEIIMEKSGFTKDFAIQLL